MPTCSHMSNKDSKSKQPWMSRDIEGLEEMEARVKFTALKVGVDPQE